MRILLLVLLPTAALAQAVLPPEPELYTENPVLAILELIVYLLSVSGAAGWMSTVLSDQGWFQRIMPLINKVGANVGRAANDPQAQK